MIKLLCLYFVLGFIHFTHALTEEEIKIKMTRSVMKCMKTHTDVSLTELTSLQRLIPPKSMEAKCLMACAYKLEGTMNKDGFYDVQQGYKIAELSKNGNETRLINGKKIVVICDKFVNQAKVNDAKKDCERAGLIFICLVENSRKFGFKL